MEAQFNRIKLALDACFTSQEFSKIVEEATAVNKNSLSELIHYAIVNRNETTCNKVKCLLDAGANLTHKLTTKSLVKYTRTNKRYSGDTLLHTACHDYQNKEIIMLLIEYGAPLNQENIQGYTAVYAYVDFCGMNFDQDIIQLMFKHGADFNHKCHAPTEERFKKALNIGHTPFNIMLSRAHVINEDGVNPYFNLIKYILETNPSVININLDVLGNTPMHYAVCNRHSLKKHISEELEQLLINNGADLTIKDRFGRTPMECVQKPLSEVLEEMKKNRKPKQKKNRFARYPNPVDSHQTKVAKLI